MIRLVGIALVIWGLIVQPLMAGMPTKMANGSTSVEVVLDFGVVEHADKNQSHHDHNTHATTEPPCHDETAGSESPSGNCNSGTIDCLNSGICASFCALSGVVLNLKSTFPLERHSTTPFFEIAEHPESGFPSYIYYPPKFF
jgi:hypothetical protein